MEKSQECLICGERLVYFECEREMQCFICKKTQMTRCACKNGHYVCDACHTDGIYSIVSVCEKEESHNPFVVLERLMSMPFCHMHGPEHHVLVGVSLLTAYRNAGGKVDFDKAFSEIKSRMEKVPGGACGFWGACGAGISAGAFVSAVTGANPLSYQEWGFANEMTGSALSEIGKIGGPRCCKRNSYLAILKAIDFCRERLHVTMQSSDVFCIRSEENAQCIKERCPFWKKGK